MEALAEASGIDYKLGLHEAVAVSMADGYARATGRPAFVNLHIAAGLANGLSNVLNARRARTPLVVSAGQQDRRHLIQDPMLGGDLLELSRGAFKAAFEIARVEDMPTLIRRAFLLAAAPPAGPVFVSVPVDLLEEQLPGELPPRSPVAPLGPATNLDDLAAALNAAKRPAIVAGDEVGRERAVDELVAVAEALVATVFHEPMYDAVNFPADHPQSAGMLTPVNASIRQALEAHDVVFLVGSHAFSPHYYSPGPAIPPSTRVVQLDSDREEIGRNYPVACGAHGGIRSTLQALAPLLRQGGDRPTPDPVAQAPAAAASPAAGDPTASAAAMVAGLPRDAILVEEAITTGLAVRRAFAASRPGSYHHSVGGALGWGIGAALGVKLAEPQAPVLAAVGDGTAMYAIQGLWTAAHEQLPITVVVFNNAEYRACKQGVEKVVAGAPTDGYPGMDLTPPAIDFLGLARALGVEARRVEGTEAISAETAAALASGTPTLLEVPITGMPAEKRRNA